MAWSGLQVGRAVHVPLDDAPRRRLVQALTNPAALPLRVAIEHLAEQLLLVAEGGIEARAVDAHGLGQIRQRRRLVTLAPEHVERTVQGFIDVEGARTSRWQRASPEI